MGRREHIGDAGVRLIARDGVHALTHLQVDTEAGLPRGSTSYYAGLAVICWRSWSTASPMAHRLTSTT